MSFLTQSMLNLVDKAGKDLSEYSACVRDYKGAFATIRLEPESACLTAVMVSDAIVMVPIATEIHYKSPFDEDKNDLFTKFPVLIGWS